jgi:hypothetical protein
MDGWNFRLLLSATEALAASEEMNPSTPSGAGPGRLPLAPDLLLLRSAPAANAVWDIRGDTGRVMCVQLDWPADGTA